MKLSRLIIQNFRCCKAVEINVGKIHAIVGANNAGKSTILRALDFLFNASVRGLNEESFRNKEVGGGIRVEAIFTGLTAAEHEKLEPYLRSDGSFQMARVAAFQETSENGDSGEEAEEQIKISQQYCKPLPKQKWLRESNISGANSKVWVKDEASLVANGKSFLEFLGTKNPKVEQWKEAARSFANECLSADDLEDAWEDSVATLAY